MMPKLKSQNYEGIELLRPLYYVREDDILAWKRYNGLEFLQCACRFTEREEEHAGARAATKQLVRHLREINPQADYNIFQSLHHVNLNMLPGWQKNGETHSFLEEYSEFCQDI